MWTAIPLNRHSRTATPQAPTARHPALLLLVLMVLAATASGAGQPSCPCLANQTQSLNGDGTIDMTLAGITYKYPGSYGVSSCSTHDDGLQPYCAARASVGSEAARTSTRDAIKHVPIGASSV